MVRGEPIESVVLILSYVFLVGRALHSVVQIFTGNIRLRGLIFTINFAAVIAMWFLLLGSPELNLIIRDVG
ncbi:MAG: MAPEG family protein [Pseudomonadota bacterium]